MYNVSREAIPPTSEGALFALGREMDGCLKIYGRSAKGA